MLPGARALPRWISGSAAPRCTPSAACPRALSNSAYSVLGTNAWPSRRAPRSASLSERSFWYSISGATPAKNPCRPKLMAGPFEIPPERLSSSGNTFATSPRSTASRSRAIEITMSLAGVFSPPIRRFQGGL